MARESNHYWLVITAVLLLGAAALFIVGSESSTQNGGVVLRLRSAPTSAQQSEATAPADGNAEVERMIHSGQFAPPPGNTDKMYSIASPFSASAPASSGTPAKTPDNPGVQPGIAMLGASTWSNAPAQDARKNPAATTEIKPHVAPAPVQSSAIEFETPPGIGSVKGGQ